VTEIIYALGAGSRLVAVDSQSIHPPEARALPQVGYVRQLAIEGLASMQPDLVIAAQDAGPPQVVTQLRSMGIPLVLAPSAGSIDETAARIRAVGEALGMADESWSPRVTRAHASRCSWGVAPAARLRQGATVPATR